ncbi:MAG: signal peptidase I [Desulfobacteraceae bacterium]|nr:MAG: signal peptidase I [Desulfobacteraceae bacterium]
MLNKWKKKLSLFWRGWGCSIVIALLIATSFKSAIADWNDVPTGSMKPTILEGDRIFVNKLAYDLKLPYTTLRLAYWDDPKRGDIVVFFSPADGKRLVKRVVGVPGDAIAMLNNQLFINGKAAEYETLDQTVISQIAPHEQWNHLFFSETIAGQSHPVMTTPKSPSLRSFSPVIVPEKHYFLMGDNRDNSADSRFFGFVKRKQIVGHATAVVISLKPDEYYLPRWDRFFQKLL